MRYSDLVGYVTFALSLPLVIVKAVVTCIPTVATVVLSYFGYDKQATAGFALAKGIADKVNTVERYLIYLLSILLNPFESYQNYRKNRKVVDLLRKNVKTGDLKRGGMPVNLRNAVMKEGWWEVSWKLIAMFSILPTFRHSFWNNPFLYSYRLYLTDQSTARFNDSDVMCRVFYAYINDPSFILRQDRDKPLRIDDIGFTPNYSNDVTDNKLDYDNYGLQVGGKTTTLLSLETLYKSPEQLLEALKRESYSSQSIMYSTHPVYTEIKEADIGIDKMVEFDTARRHVVLDLVVPYDDYYHLVTGKVEANIRDGCIIEHPMLCLYHDGQMMVKTWSLIEGLFRDNVMGYLSQYGGSNPSPLTP